VLNWLSLQDVYLGRLLSSGGFLASHSDAEWSSLTVRNYLALCRTQLLELLEQGLA
jgi:hypothetical protein